MMRRAARATLGCLLVAALAAGGYAIAVALAPLPELRPALGVEAVATIEADPSSAQEIVDELALPTGFGWQDGESTWVNDDIPHPLASITKLIVATVGQELDPVDETRSEIYTWGWADAAQQSELLAQDSIIIPIEVGTQVSRADLLRAALIPSANDFMLAYVRATFGSEEAVIDEIAAWAARHDLSSLTIVEPTGLDERNAATMADIIDIARIALQDPFIAETVQQSEAYISGIGPIATTNPLLGLDPRVHGIKTGTLYESGYSLVLAATLAGDTRDMPVVAVTLGRDSAQAREIESYELLNRIETLPTTARFDDPRRVGSVITWDGTVIDLVADPVPEVELWPGEIATRGVHVDSRLSAMSSGAVVGSVTLQSPSGTTTRDIVTSQEIPIPGFWWRFTHPAAVFLTNR